MIPYSQMFALLASGLMAISIGVADETAQTEKPARQSPAWFKQADKDDDGKLSREEAPNKNVFGDVDADGDGFASLTEVNTWLAKQPKPAANPRPQATPAAQLGNAAVDGQRTT